MKTERRTTPANSRQQVTHRSEGSVIIGGIAAVFYDGTPATQYWLAEDLVERISKAAFDTAIREKHDARALFNHEPDNLLGRVGSGTCKLSTDNVGLRYEINIDPNDADHQRVVAKVTRGDLTGSSFAFRPTKVRWEDEGDISVRWIEDLVLFDVGPVTYPAYEATTTALSGDELDQLRDQRDVWLAAQFRVRQLQMAGLKKRIGAERFELQQDDLTSRRQKLAALLSR